MDKMELDRIYEEPESYLLNYNLEDLDCEIIRAAKKNDCKAVVALMHMGAVESFQDSDGNTALHWAAKHNNICMVKLLCSNRNPACVENKVGETPLFYAIENDADLDLMELLIRFEGNVKYPTRPEIIGDVGFKNENSLTCFDLAIRKNHLPLVEMMIKYGADKSFLFADLPKLSSDMQLLLKKNCIIESSLERPDNNSIIYQLAPSLYHLDDTKTLSNGVALLDLDLKNDNMEIEG